MQEIIRNMSGLLRRSLLVRNTAWMTFGHGVRLIFQGVYFVLVARALGVAAYGAFVGAVALVAVVAPFSSWGTGFILIKEVARSREAFSACWGASITVTVLAGSLLVCLVAGISPIIWGNSVPFKLLLLVAISDIVIVRIVDLAAQAFAAIELLKKSAEVYVMLSITRAASAGLLFLLWRTPNLIAWGWLYLLSAVVATLYSVFVIAHTAGRPAFGIRPLRGQWKEGFYFAVSQASLTLHNDIDKTMLVRLAGLEATGIYGAAYRISDVSFAPISALVYSTLAGFFRHGEAGLSEAIRFAKKLIVYSSAYGALAALMLFLVSPVLPSVIGHDFAKSVFALRWLSPIVLIRAVHYFLANSLSGSGHQGSRTLAQLAIVGVNILLNLWLIPQYSWRGAAWSSLLSDTALILALLIVIRYWLTRSNLSEQVVRLRSEVLQ